MTTFFIDLWQDLREKRLWPVAVGLLAATAAIPLLLFKPASDAAPSTPTTTNAGPREALPVVSVETGPSRGSNLATFKEKNPFKPMKDLAKEADAAQSDSGTSNAAASGSAASGGSGTGSGSTGSGSSDSGSGSTSTPPGFDPSGPRVQWFRYAADFQFGVPGKEKTYNKADTFTLLPSKTKPVVVYMGVTDDHKHAQFFVSDEGFTAGGEGSCNKGSSCRFITLSLADTDDEMTFTSLDGELTYNLKLTDIQRENLSTGKTTGDTSGDPAGKKLGKSLAAGAGDVVDAAGSAGAAAEPLLPGVPVSGGAVARESK
jgi:hypothetical protein